MNQFEKFKTGLKKIKPTKKIKPQHTHQTFLLAQVWSKYSRLLNIPQLKLGNTLVSNRPQFSKQRMLQKIFEG